MTFAPPTPAPSASRRILALVCAALLAVVGLLVPASRALAAPTESYLGLTEVQTLIDNGPASGLPGHLTTVLGGGKLSQQTPVSLPLTVLSVVPDAGPAGALILFRMDMAHPAMAAMGNIAEGMSGSPVYVDGAGGGKLIGALSYGDAFTTGGLALATPIEDMLGVESAGLNANMTAQGITATRQQTRQATAIDPITVGKQKITKIVLDAPTTSAAAAKKAKAAAAADPTTVHFRSLSTMRISGLPAASPAYQKLSADLVKRGHSVLAPLAGASAAASDDFTTPLIPGAAVGAVYSLGDVVVGGVGTVTYTTPKGGVVAFGHPLDWTGPTSAILTNARVAGIWSSSLASYKLATPGHVQGTLLQDRAAGIGGRIGAGPATYPVTSTATVKEAARSATKTGVTQVTPMTFDLGIGPDLAAAAAAAPAYRAADAVALAGTAENRVSVTVNDGTKDYTVSRSSRYGDDSDVLGASAYEVGTIVSTLMSGREGLIKVRSIDATSTVDTKGLRATLEGVTSTGLKPGRTNQVTVAVRPIGSSTLVPITVALPIPAAMPAKGELSITTGLDEVPDPKDDSLGALVTSLNAALDAGDLVVEYTSDDSPLTARTVVRTSYALEGELEAKTSQTVLARSASTIVAGASVTLMGAVDGALEGDKVTVQRQTRGQSTWTTVRTVALEDGEDGATFSMSDRPSNSSVYRAVYPGSQGIVLGSTSGSVAVGVRGKVALTGTRTSKGFRLSAALTPKEAGHRITFQQLSKGKWRTIKTVTTASDGTAAYSWTTGRGKHKVRASLAATTDLAANVSRTVTLKR